jgi:predicted transcriptional regulator
MVSFRLPDELIKQLNAISEAQGWSLTDIAQTALDLYVQCEGVKDSKVRKKKS